MQKLCTVNPVLITLFFKFDNDFRCCGRITVNAKVVYFRRNIEDFAGLNEKAPLVLQIR